MDKLKKILGQILLLLFCSLVSYYLTWTIDKITLETDMQFLFVFIYFLVATYIVCLLLKKRIPGTKPKQNVLYLIVSGILSIAIIISCFDFFLGLYKPMKINITAVGTSVEMKEGQKGTEVWLHKVTVNNKQVNLEEILPTEGWENRDGVLLSYQNQPNTLTLEFSNVKNITMKFLSHPWSGTVIVDNGFQKEQLDLFNPDMAGSYIDLTLNGKHGLSSLKDYFLLVSCLVLLWGISFILINIWHSSFNAHGKSVLNTYGTFLLPLFLYIILFILTTNVKFEASTKIIFLLTTIGIASILKKAIVSIKEYFTFTNNLLLLIIIIYSTFALVGHSLFLSGTLFEIDLINLASFLLYLVIISLHILVGIYLLHKYANKPTTKILPNRRKYRLFRVISGIIIFVLLMILTLPFYPGNITSDGVDIWAQAKGITKLYDHHPVLYTLIIRLLNQVWDSPYNMVVLNSLFFAFVVSGILTLIYKKGYNVKFLIILSIIVSILPNTYMMMSLISKNILFTNIMLWLTYLIMRIFDEKEAFFKNLVNITAFILCNVLLNLIRHNGFIVLFITGIFLLYCTIRYWGKIKVIPILVFTFLLLSNSLAKHIIYTSFDVERSVISSRGMNGPLLSPLGAALKYEKELPSETIKMLEKIAPIQQWKKYYNPYLRDTFSFSDPIPQYQKVTTKDAFKIYLSTLWQYPDIVIKDRLDNANLVWNILQPKNVYNDRFAVGIWPMKGATEENMPQLLQAEKKLPNGSYYKENNISKLLVRAASSSFKIEAVDIFIWRNGIYLVITFVLCVYLIQSNNKKYIFIFAPALAVVFSYILAIGWQIYQYLWFYPLITLFSFIYILADIRTKNWIGNYEKEKRMIF